jgi:signal transduction histidine kinase
MCSTGQGAARPAQLGFFDQVKEFCSHLFSASDWPARWYCGKWSDFHGWLYIFSDLLIWASYFAIPVLLLVLIKRRTDIPFPKLIWLFGAFIILCGITHLVDAGMFWWPVYRLSAVLRLLTGLVSSVTVFVLYKIIPDITSLRTVKDLEKEIAIRQVAEDKLAASEFLLSEAGRMGKVGGWELNAINKHLTWAKPVYDIHELPYNHQLEIEDAYSYYTPQYRVVIEQAVNECFREGKSFDLELQIKTANGRLLWVRAYGEALYDTAGNLLKLRGVFMDIDRYKVNELSLNKSVELVSLHNKQLKSFNHILSHNIRNHSSNLTLVSSLVNSAALDEDNALLFDKIRTISRLLNGTLDDLAKAIKIREVQLASELLDFEKITEDVFAIINSLVIANNAVITYDFKVKQITFPGIYLESILVNLLTNAIKYKKENESPVITLRTYYDVNGDTVLECQDNGSGIDLALHGNKIFGLYKTFHGRNDASGVGLFLIKTQVESQGGEIFVYSAVGQGATFKIVFHEKS